MNTNEKMKQRKIKAVIGYHEPNKHKEPELYFCHLLMLYYPWRHEGTLLDSDDTYVSKFYETNVKNIVEHNREMFEPDAEAVTEALEWLRNNQNDIIHSCDSFGDQENEDIQLEAQDESLEESINEQQPSHLGRSSPTEQHGQTGMNISAPSTS